MYMHFRQYSYVMSLSHIFALLNIYVFGVTNTGWCSYHFILFYLHYFTRKKNNHTSS